MSLTPPEFVTSPLAGLDFSWLAVDDDDHVAWLVTFGSAVVPKWVEERRDDFVDFEDALTMLPEQGGCVARETPHNIEQWRAAARSGVFAYDWDVYNGPYNLVAAPVVSLKVEALPAHIAALARRTHFAGVCFCERPTLGLHDVLACRQGALPLAP
jgi:hypothetical protein